MGLPICDKSSLQSFIVLHGNVVRQSLLPDHVLVEFKDGHVEKFDYIPTSEEWAGAVELDPNSEGF